MTLFSYRPFFFCDHLISTYECSKVMFCHLVPFVFVCESDSGVFINSSIFITAIKRAEYQNYVKVGVIDQIASLFVLNSGAAGLNLGHSRTWELVLLNIHQLLKSDSSLKATNLAKNFSKYKFLRSKRHSENSHWIVTSFI